MVEKLTMPERLPEDGAVTISRLGEQFVEVTVVTSGAPERIAMSRYNAWRVLGMLSVMLGIPLTKAANNAIKLGGHGPGSMTFSHPLPPNPTLGDRVAVHLVHEKTVELLKEMGYPVSLPEDAIHRETDDLPRRK